MLQISTFIFVTVLPVRSQNVITVLENSQNDTWSCCSPESSTELQLFAKLKCSYADINWVSCGDPTYVTARSRVCYIIKRSRP